ncbi:hypothetical protein POM88_011778 [Heracleum sosnowskyi]|uniref:CYTH domain-containing protein n=1 Tax=Heracleum sosnowskyi TaxID=360622 RepID=A0AAD8IV71_9APIA|nr:hypothetical protein POM88_011778 [Heracleum sosnowskyi]
MEVEVKLKLPDSTTHQNLQTLLAPFHVITHSQYNTFFDGASAELSTRRAVLRLRFYGDNVKCVVSLKAKAVLVDGVSRVEEDEEEIDPLVGQECVRDPTHLGSVDSRVVKRARDEFGVSEKGFVCLGGFRNVRGVYEWKGLKLELDETISFQICYFSIRKVVIVPKRRMVGSETTFAILKMALLGDFSSTSCISFQVNFDNFCVLDTQSRLLLRIATFVYCCQARATLHRITKLANMILGCRDPECVPNGGKNDSYIICVDGYAYAFT